MRYPHFFKAHSRLGLKNIPHRQYELNQGVEKGPEAILTEKFLNTFPRFKLSKFIFPLPEELKEEEFNTVMAAHLEDFTKLILSQTKPDQTQVVVGGDHSVAFASIAAILEKNDPKDLGYLHIDSHPDVNLFSSSPTKNFHGMYLRPFILDDFDIPQIKKLLTKKLYPENMIFIGNLDIDEEERVIFDDLQIVNINCQTPDATKMVAKFIKRFKHLHISVDIDVFDKTEAPATGIPAENGIKKAKIWPILHLIARHPSISLDFVEVNPHKEGARQTIDLAQEILKKILW